MTASRHSDPADDGYVDVTGCIRRTSFSVRYAALEGLWWETVERPEATDSGPTITAWRGVPVGDLLDMALVGRDATHLVVHGTGERSVRVPLRVARGSVLAIARDGGPNAPIEDAPVFVTSDPEVGTVSRVTELEVVVGPSTQDTR